MQPGDVLLTGRKAQGIVSLAIKLGQRLRGYTPAERQYSHAALVLDTDGTIAEAQAKGVVYDHASKYAEGDYTVVSTGVDEHDRAQVLAFAHAVVAARTRYGFVTFAGLALYCLTGGTVFVERSGTAICSGFVADALTRAGVIWPKPPFACLPADVAREFLTGRASG